VATRLQVTFDAVDPHELCAFWAQAVHYDVEDHSAVVTGLLEAGRVAPDEVVEHDGRPAFRDLAACRDPLGAGPRLLFQRVPEPKTAKDRQHLDLQVGPDAAPAEVDRLVALGATVAWVTADRGPTTTTLRDPEGHELCVS
jgi:hypothetical protein